MNFDHIGAALPSLLRYPLNPFKAFSMI